MTSLENVIKSSQISINSMKIVQVKPVSSLIPRRSVKKKKWDTDFEPIPELVRAGLEDGLTGFVDEFGAQLFDEDGKDDLVQGHIDDLSTTRKEDIEGERARKGNHGRRRTHLGSKIVPLLDGAAELVAVEELLDLFGVAGRRGAFDVRVEAQRHQLVLLARHQAQELITGQLTHRLVLEEAEREERMVLVDLLEALLCGHHVDARPLVEGLADALADDGLAGDLHGQHVVGGAEHLGRAGELGRHELERHLGRLRRVLLDLVALVVVAQVLGELLRRQAVLAHQAVQAGARAQRVQVAAPRLLHRLGTLPLGLVVLQHQGGRGFVQPLQRRAILTCRQSAHVHRLRSHIQIPSEVLYEHSDWVPFHQNDTP